MALNIKIEMKKITKNTLLICDDITYQPVEIDNVIYWCTGKQPTFADAHSDKDCYYIFENKIYKREYTHHVNSSTIFAQSEPHLSNVPVINIDNETIEHLLYLSEQCYNNRQFKASLLINNKIQYLREIKPIQSLYTQKELEKCVDLVINNMKNQIDVDWSTDDIINEISTIKKIHIDLGFNIKYYE